MPSRLFSSVPAGGFRFFYCLITFSGLAINTIEKNSRSEAVGQKRAKNKSIHRRLTSGFLGALAFLPSGLPRKRGSEEM